MEFVLTKTCRPSTREIGARRRGAIKKNIYQPFHLLFISQRQDTRKAPRKHSTPPAPSPSPPFLFPPSEEKKKYCHFNTEIKGITTLIYEKQFLASLAKGIRLETIHTHARTHKTPKEMLPDVKFTTATMLTLVGDKVQNALLAQQNLMQKRADHDPYDRAYVHPKCRRDHSPRRLQKWLRRPCYQVLGCSVQIQLRRRKTKITGHANREPPQKSM